MCKITCYAPALSFIAVCQTRENSRWLYYGESLQNALGKWRCYLIGYNGNAPTPVNRNCHPATVNLTRRQLSTVIGSARSIAPISSCTIDSAGKISVGNWPGVGNYVTSSPPSGGADWRRISQLDSQLYLGDVHLWQLLLQSAVTFSFYEFLLLLLLLTKTSSVPHLLTNLLGGDLAQGSTKKKNKQVSTFSFRWEPISYVTTIYVTVMGNWHSFGVTIDGDCHKLLFKSLFIKPPDGFIKCMFHILSQFDGIKCAEGS